MEQDGFKIEIKENGEHILVNCTSEAKDDRGIIVIPKDVTGIRPRAFNECYGYLKISIYSYSLVPDLIKCNIGKYTSIYDYDYSDESCWITLESLTRLYELYPKAFEAKEDGKCLFDNHSIVAWEKFKSLAIARLLDDQSNKVVVLAHSDALEVIPDSVSNKPVEAFVRLDSSYESSTSSIVIPSSISTVIIDGSRKLDKITFTGSLPEHIFLHNDFKADKIYINEPRNEAIKHPAFESIENAVKRESRYDDGVIIYAAPELCNEDSLNPGYIVLTEPYNWSRWHDEDQIVEINTFFIASIEPHSIECYTPVEGTLLKLSIEMKADRRYEYLVYEPIDVVRKKIRESL
ncbi:MAG: hypothetical protein J6W94_01965, partial [Bacteroidales bacterium]|nr:hypothetical protein [Bacteroidales bacterium]